MRMSPNQKKLLLAFYIESQKKPHDYVKNITADKLGMSLKEFGEAFRYLYEQQLIWIYQEQDPSPDTSSHFNKFENAFISSLGKEIAQQLLEDES